MAKFVKIDQDTCIACGSCYSEAPTIFDELDDGIAFVIADDNAGTAELDPSLEDDLEAALDSCPTDSILVQDTPFS